jgi:hypothetical protein
MGLGRRKPKIKKSAGLNPEYNTALNLYSFRKLNPAYTGDCVNIRRASDNDLSDIGFSSNFLNLSDISAFCGASAGTMRRFYDQSLNVSANMYLRQETTPSNQPTLYNGSNFFLVNSLPYIDFSATIDILLQTPSLFSIAGDNPIVDDFIISIVFQSQSSSSLQNIFTLETGTTGTNGAYFRSNTSGTDALNFRVTGNPSNIFDYNSSLSTSSGHVLTVARDTGNIISVYLDGILQDQKSEARNFTGTPSLRLGHDRQRAGSFSGKVSELITYNYYDADILTTLMSDQINFYTS